MEVEADDIIPEYYPEQQEGYNEAVKQERVVEAGKQSAERTSFISRNPSSAPRQEQQIDDVIEHEPEPQQQPQENANARHQASQEPQQQSGNDEVNVF
ncbi:MAG: hypothetical protein IBX50_17195, partial [Marinospirillum sp.]|uniref:hypothetical protein n=1 Tax=Marinospirillum sp. TaxID=2183934 RepID=UPI001A01794C